MPATSTSTKPSRSKSILISDGTIFEQIYLVVHLPEHNKNHILDLTLSISMMCWFQLSTNSMNLDKKSIENFRISLLFVHHYQILILWWIDEPLLPFVKLRYFSAVFGRINNHFFLSSQCSCDKKDFSNHSFTIVILEKILNV